jgi:NAD(P)-dependent dehydrogenase (short-subunit alcohol dehydrogenase family)
MGLLDGQLALVTGAGSGIGQAIATAYAREGARVVVTDMDKAKADATVAAIAEQGGKATAHVLDVTSREPCEKLAGEIKAQLGPVSVLVNNAGIVRRNLFGGDAEAVIKDWQEVLATNLTGPFNVTHAFLGHLRETRGRIVNIGSIQSRVHVRTPSSPAYTTSKHGLLGFTRALAAELGKDGIRVNAIGPGFIETPLNEAARRTNTELVKAFVAHTPLGRTGTAADIAGPAVFLASDMSAYVSGAMLMVDGGYTAV